jgi:hypothetical protein
LGVALGNWGLGSSKTPYTYFGKKSMSKTFPKISTKISMSVFPRLLFVLSFIAFLGAFQRWEFKTLKKKVLQKNRVEKFLQKIRPKTKNPKPTFSRFFSHVFGRFLVRGVQKHDKKISHKGSNFGL